MFSLGRALAIFFYGVEVILGALAAEILIRPLVWSRMRVESFRSLLWVAGMSASIWGTEITVAAVVVLVPLVAVDLWYLDMLRSKPVEFHESGEAFRFTIPQLKLFNARRVVLWLSLFMMSFTTWLSSWDSDDTGLALRVAALYTPILLNDGGGFGLKDRAKRFVKAMRMVVAPKPVAARVAARVDNRGDAGSLHHRR